MFVQQLLSSDKRFQQLLSIALKTARLLQLKSQLYKHHYIPFKIIVNLLSTNQGGQGTS